MRSPIKLDSGRCIVLHFDRGGKPFEEQWKIAAQNDVGRQTSDRLRLHAFHEKAAQGFEGKFALREGPLVKGGEYFTRLDQRNELGKEVGSDESDATAHSVFFKRAKDRDAVGGIDVDAAGTGLALQERERDLIGLFRAFVRFDGGNQREMGRHGGKCGCKSAQFLTMIKCVEVASDGGHGALRLENSAE